MSRKNNTPKNTARRPQAPISDRYGNMRKHHRKDNWVVNAHERLVRWSNALEVGYDFGPAITAAKRDARRDMAQQLLEHQYPNDVTVTYLHLCAMRAIENAEGGRGDDSEETVDDGADWMDRVYDAA